MGTYFGYFLLSFKPDQYKKPFFFHNGKVFISNPRYSGESKERISDNMKSILEKAGLINLSRLETTREGYQFLLSDLHTQLWSILRGYIKEREKYLKENEILDVLFQLSTLHVGSCYSLEKMDERKKTIINDLRNFGIVFKDKDVELKEKCFFPTSLVKRFSVDNCSSSEGKSMRKGWIIMETNYKIYAYTDSALEISMIELFCTLDYRLPNMIVATINRDSVLSALLKGINGHQIVDFLHKNAHARMLSKYPVVPSTLRDQIFSWEKERKRLDFTQGVLCSDIEERYFSKILEFAKQNSFWIWNNNKFIFVHKHSVNKIREYHKYLKNI